MVACEALPVEEKEVHNISEYEAEDAEDIEEVQQEEETEDEEATADEEETGDESENSDSSDRNGSDDDNGSISLRFFQHDINELCGMGLRERCFEMDFHRDGFFSFCVPDLHYTYLIILCAVM